MHLLLDEGAYLRDAIHFGHWRLQCLILMFSVKFVQLLNAESVWLSLGIVHSAPDFTQSDSFFLFLTDQGRSQR